MKTPNEIKEGLKRCICSFCGDCPFNGFGSDEVIVDALVYIDQLEYTMPKWISADEPPEYWENRNEGMLINYLVFIPDYGVDIGNYVKLHNMWFVNGIQANVTHWMPLPEQPKEY